jgi:hypothetical protein
MNPEIFSLWESADKMRSLKSVWKNAMIQLSVMSEDSEDEKFALEASTLMEEMRASAKPGESHARWGEFLRRYCRLLDTDIQRISMSPHRTMDEVWMGEHEIEALETLRTHAEMWAKVYLARYPSA